LFSEAIDKVFGRLQKLSRSERLVCYKKRKNLQCFSEIPVHCISERLQDPVRDLSDLVRGQIQLIRRFVNAFFFEMSQPEHTKMLGTEPVGCMSQQPLNFLKLLHFVGWCPCFLRRMRGEQRFAFWQRFDFRLTILTQAIDHLVPDQALQPVTE